MVENPKTTDNFVKIYEASKGREILLWDTLYRYIKIRYHNILMNVVFGIFDGLEIHCSVFSV